MGVSGPKLKLNNKKIKNLFQIMQVAVQDKYIASALGLNKADTVRIWVNYGRTLIDQYEEQLEPLDDICPWDYEVLWESRKLEADAEFRMMFDIDPEDKIADRLYVEYNNFMTQKKNLFIEQRIQERENKFLDELKIIPNERLNEEAILYIKFARVYDRARACKELQYIKNIDKHAGSSKNVALSMKMLEKLNKEDFADTQTVNHTGTLEVNTKSILAMALSYEKEQRQLLESKNQNIIDVTPVNMIEQKDGN
jgi:hypothetical protein